MPDLPPDPPGPKPSLDASRVPSPKLSLRDRLATAAAPPLVPTPGRVLAARVIAAAADATQLLLFPLFGEGFASPLDDALDLLVGAALIKLVGFHWSFLPVAAAELIPGVDLAPTWTAAVLFATRKPGSTRKLLLYLLLGVALGAMAWLVWHRFHQG